MNRKTTLAILGITVVMLGAPAGLFAFETFDSYPGFSYDIGAGSGYSSDGGFYEINGALNTHLQSWLVWRNSAFFRGQTDADNFFGLDTSMQAGSRFELGPQAILDYHGGAGYRFTSIGDHAPFAEAGAGYRVGGLQIGANAKYILYDVVGEDRDNEFVFSVSVSGSTSGTF
jgi:hypothetical protein